MRRLTLRERDAIQIGSIDGLTEDEAAAFARLEPALPAGSITWEHRAIRFGPFCGVMRASSITVELLPKIDELQQDADDGARGLLVSMLRATNTLSVSATGDSVIGQQKQHLLDYFILDFCIRVSVALRGGAIARYQQLEENRNALRGRLRFTEHLRQNALDASHIFCSFDDRTIDNAHNRGLKAVLAVLRLHAISGLVRGTVTSLLHRFDEITDTTASADDIGRLSFDRMTRHWEPVFERARWLLRGLFPDVRLGTIDGSCLLFNMERLFEGFLGVKVRQAWDGRSAGRFRVALQGPTHYFAQSSDGPAFRLRPDITILENGQPVRIFDAKWKRLESGAFSCGIAQADVYQLASYASRYGCERVALVYPASKNNPPGLLTSFRIGIPTAPVLEVHAVDVRKLAFGGLLPSNLQPPLSAHGDREITVLPVQARMVGHQAGQRE